MMLREKAQFGQTRPEEQCAFESKFRNLIVLTETGMKPKIAP
jgi:hypothetical protein